MSSQPCPRLRDGEGAHEGDSEGNSLTQHGLLLSHLVSHKNLRLMGAFLPHLPFIPHSHLLVVVKGPDHSPSLRTPHIAAAPFLCSPQAEATFLNPCFPFSSHPSRLLLQSLPTLTTSPLQIDVVGSVGDKLCGCLLFHLTGAFAEKLHQELKVCFLQNP